MIRIDTRRFSLGVMVCLAGGAAPLYAQQIGLRPTVKPVSQIVAQAGVTQQATTGQTELHGAVVDDGGQPLVGAVVSAVGAVSEFAVSDRDGRFVFKNILPGQYLLRAHHLGYQPARGRTVQVPASARTSSRIVLTHLPEAEQATPVLAAGVGPADISIPAPADRHDHDEVAWRMRHGKRSVLKDAEQAIAVAALDDGNSFFERAMGSSARLASALFGDVALNGQIDLLTTTSFERPQDLFTMNVGAPRGIAYVALAAPGARGDWQMRGTITQGDLSSWIVAGSYVRHAPEAHAYEAGLSYSKQRYLGGNPEALAAMRDGSRNVGSVYAYDTWTLNPRLTIGYGAEYAGYDYLADRGLFSPRATVSFRPSPDDEHLVVRATVAHREIAPGAEEFLTPDVGLWLPPERTFSHISRAAFQPERFDHVEMSVERPGPGDILLGFRAFRQRINDQLATLFGPVDPTRSPIGHYQVGAAGDARTHGWGVSVGRAVASGTRASVDYTQIDADWIGKSLELDALDAVAASIRRSSETIHDVTASLESAIAATATRFYVVYKLNTAFAAPDAAGAPSSGTRFNVQINQALPFLHFSATHWEMLVAVSNLFHRELSDGSVYDELLVVRPPKRVLGGVTVRF